MLRKPFFAAPTAALLAIALGLGGAVVATTAASAQPDQICAEAGYESKIDTTGDPATVSVTAPDGFLIDAYCVKAGPTKVLVSLNPRQAIVIIDHPDMDSVSHYQVRLVPVSIQPVAITPLLFTFMQDCDPDTHVWRVRNPNPDDVQASWRTNNDSANGAVTAVAGQDTFFDGVVGTKILSWGGGDTGVVAGTTTKAGGNDGDKPNARFNYVWDRAGGFTVTVTQEGCSTGQTLNVSSYTLDKSAQNVSTQFGAGNPTSFPQTIFAHAEDILLPPATVKLATGWTVSRTVALPPCGDYQSDLYTGTKLEIVGVGGHHSGDNKFLAGGIVLQQDCATPASLAITQSQCVVDVSGNFTGFQSPSAVVLAALPVGIQSAVVHNVVDGALAGKPTDLSNLSPGDYRVTATPMDNYRILAENGWTLSVSGKAVFVFTIAEVDCTVTPVDDVPMVVESEWVFVSSNCASQTITETRTVMTTPYMLVNNVNVPDTANQTTKTETEPRDMNGAEKTEICPVFELPTLPLVSPSATATTPTCATMPNGSYALSNTEGVTWVVNDAEKAPGTYQLAAGAAATVTAVANEGYGFGFEQQTEWKFAFAATEVCPLDELPTLPLPETELPTLAFTGGSIQPGLAGLVALVITLTGLGLVAARRRMEV